MYILIYNYKKNVKIAAEKRNIIVSISGGKDSTVLCWLAQEESIIKELKRIVLEKNIKII